MRLASVVRGVALLAIAVLFAVRPGEAAESPRTNVVLILVDDFGYETVAANGGTSYATPRLDQLAAEGTRFERCFVQPLCTPTRVQLMTGASNVRNYETFGYINPELTTFAQLFERAGYATCIAGKWQLGREKALPARLGFQEAYLWQHLRRPPRYANPGLELNGVEHDYENGEYGPDLIAAHADDFITRHRNRPFLLYYPMLLTHAPYQPTPDSPDWNPAAIGERVAQDPRHFGEMVTYLDKLVGRLVDRIDALGLREHTLILLVGDNGTGRGTRSQMGPTEIVGGKGSTTAAGMHVPLIARWPGHGPAGQVSGALIESTDFLPTLCEAAGIDVPGELVIDGQSFLSQIRGQAGPRRSWVYCWYAPRGGVPRECAFNERFKLYRTGELYAWSDDPLEQHPLIGPAVTPEAAAAARQLAGVLEKYRDARPEQLKSQAARAAQPRPGNPQQ